MDPYLPITDVYAREILDSRGNPTLEVEVLAGEHYVGRASVPSGASTGTFEAVELRDQEPRYLGKGVKNVARRINEELVPDLLGKNIYDQRDIDQWMIKRDGTEQKRIYGANGILGISMATARAAAKASHLPLFSYLNPEGKYRMPKPMMNVINGGRHAKNHLDFQEFMIVPIGAESFEQALEMGTEVYHTLKLILEKEGKQTAVGDEGGFAPDFKDAFEALSYLEQAVEQAGYKVGEDIGFAIDAAASELHQEDAGMYYFPGESKMMQEERCDCKMEPDTILYGVMRSTDEMIAYYQKLCDTYPILSIEDALNEEDWEGWQKLTEQLGDQVMLVGDDLFVTNKKRLQKGIDQKCANAILIKLNQVGSLTETIETIELAEKAGYQVIISHRSGETVDDFISDLAVAVSAGYLKAGAPCRGERVAKYNRLLRIQEELKQ